MENKANWEMQARQILKNEIKKKNLTYQQLCERLAVIGVVEKPENIANKISRGRFSAVFLIQCLTVLESKKLNLVAHSLGGV